LNDTVGVVGNGQDRKRFQWPPRRGGRTLKRIVIGMLTLLLLSLFASLPPAYSISDDVDNNQNPTGIERFHLPSSSEGFSDLQPSNFAQGEEKNRLTVADTHLGIFTVDGLQSNIEVPQVLTTIRPDIALVLVHGDVGLWDARVELTALPSIEVRAHIPPSGFLVQGPSSALATISQLEVVAAVHQLPLAFMVDSQLSDVIAEAATISTPSSISTAIQMNGWRESDLGTPLDYIRLGTLSSDLGSTAENYLSDYRQIDSGRHVGVLNLEDLPTVVADPALSWMSLEPVWNLHNNLAVGHMRADDVENYFPSIGLNGSGHSVTVADSGIDRDHGDFNGRIEHVESVTWGDSSTEDVHSGHGTHVACTVLGNGSRGGYAGVAPQAKLRFQAMEDDSSGNFGGVSMDSLVRKAYEGNSHIHTNSWGADGYYGEYTTSSEDADSRTSAYDQFWSYNGMIVLVSAGNDGPTADSITPPATAKNVVAVGNHHNRGGGAPSTLAEGSSRGPTDDGRIKPDVTAPGSWVRSCLSQEATDTSTSTWTSQWYLEYSGTSMAAPNAAGASVLIREYLMEVAGRPAPQGALIKGLLILGAEDSGTRDIPNMDEGWGRVNLANSLIPGSHTGIWVDDRTSIRSGQTKEYLFNLSHSNTPFKVVLTWSDYPGSTWSNKQLQNDLNMVVTSPDGTEYLGNDFANGRSTTGGDADDTNNVEVVLIDQANSGLWTVTINDVSHGGQRSEQPFALAVRGAGVNDLRSDPLPVVESLQLSTDIPQVNEVCEISIQIRNQGGGGAENLRVQAIAGGQNLGEVELDLGPGMTRWATWDWTPSAEGQKVITIRIDPNDLIEEIDEDNNMFESPIAVSAPGVRVSTEFTTKFVEDPSVSSTYWDFTIRNTALIPTNASISATRPIYSENGQEMSGWFTSFTQTTFSLSGSESANVGFTLVHDSPPNPGLYQFVITAKDEDNNIEFPLSITLDVPVLPEIDFQSVLSVIPVHPTEPTSFTVDVKNIGNGNQGYNIYLEPPLGWWLGLDNLGSTSGSTTGSTGAIPVDAARTVEMTLIPPSGTPSAAGLSVSGNMKIISQIDPDQEWDLPLNFEVIEFESALIEIESEMNPLRPDSTTYLQFTVTNIGNIPLTLTPNTDDRPGGWSVTMGTQNLEIPIGESIGYVLGLEGNGFAAEGPLNLYFSTQNGYQLTWVGQLDVLEETKPAVNFYGTTDVNGNLIQEQPVGEPGFIGTWLITNDGSTAWTPTVSLALPDSSWSALCDPVSEISGGASAEISCVIIAPSFAEAGWQPEISLNVDAQGTVATSIDALYIASNPSVVWQTISIDESMADEESYIYLEVLNTGNTEISDRILITSPSGWDVSVQDGDIASISIGGRLGVVLVVTPDSSGEGVIEIGFETSESDAILGSQHLVSMDVISNPDSQDTGSSVGLTIAITGLIVFIIGGLILAGILVVKLRQKAPSKAPSSVQFTQYQNNPQIANQNQVIANHHAQSGLQQNSVQQQVQTSNQGGQNNAK